MKYQIADLNFSFEISSKILKERTKKYGFEDKIKTDIKLLNIKSKFSEDNIDNPALQEYITTGLAFARALLDFNGFCLHSSAIAVDNKAVLFAAKSGTGKSTHTRLWREYFGEDKAIMINDDKPAIRLMEDGVFYAYGTPWSGKTDLNTNVKVPLAAIVLLERSDTNWIEPVNRREAVMQIYVHALKPEDGDKDKTIKLMDIVGKTAEKIPVYRMGCTISEEAVKLAYEATILGKIRK
ncbi:MAG: hypothetical protein EUB_00857 [Eubacterium sp.]|uniref:hypothetical protein n=1 Tax=Eubacterium sp. TaxID=142586 RepID=UPI00304B3785